MRPNLKVYDITDLYLSFTLPLSDDVIAKIRKASPLDDEGDSLFLDSYKVGINSHKAWAWILGVDKDATSTRVQLNYELGKGGRLRKSLPRISELFDILSLIEEEATIDCQVNFRFEKRRKVRPIIPLPMKLMESPDMPFDEIDMLHVVKREGERTKYGVLLGLLAGGILRETVYFDHHARIQKSLVNDIIEEAASISNRFILKGE